MSNPDVEPHETVCAALPHTSSTIEIIEPRTVPLGGLRAMNVRRTLPQRSRSLIGAWCFLDHYGPESVATSGGMNVPAHPHTGLQTASWLFSGEIEHRDSAGFHAFVRPGELNLMTAGNGISHSERSTPETTQLHGAQLWIALPESARHGAKTFEHYAPPTVHGTGWSAQVFLGSTLGHTSPVATHTPLLGAEISLAPGASLDIELRTDFEHGVLVDTGAVTALTSANDDATEIGKDCLAYVPTGAASLRLVAGDAGARLLFLGGEPFPEEIVMWWNFIGRDHDEIMQARADWQAEIAAAGVADVSQAAVQRSAHDSTGINAHSARFGLPDSEPEPPLPAPATPIARLKPRRH